jgi:HSP20 family protein
MNAQVATALESTTSSVPVKQFATGDLFDRIQQTYDSTARRAFEIFENNGRWLGHDMEDWFRAETELLQRVLLEMTESDDSLTVRAEVPGFGSKELEISIEPGTLIIAGKHEPQEVIKKCKTVYSELSADEILRVVNLPAEINSSKARASLKDGILTIELPKTVPTKNIGFESRQFS